MTGDGCSASKSNIRTVAPEFISGIVTPGGTPTNEAGLVSPIEPSMIEFAIRKLVTPPRFARKISLPDCHPGAASPERAPPLTVLENK